MKTNLETPSPVGEGRGEGLTKKVFFNTQEYNVII